jgi:hypothetical protein
MTALIAKVACTSPRMITSKRYRLLFHLEVECSQNIFIILFIFSFLQKVLFHKNVANSYLSFDKNNNSNDSNISNDL